MTTVATVTWQSPDIKFSGGGGWATYGGRKHMGSAVPGSSLWFLFNGTEAWVAGSVYPLLGRKPWAIACSIDGSTPTVLFGPDAQSDISNTGLWETGKLSADKEHNITVQVVQADIDTPFLFDSILFIPISTQPTSSQTDVTYTKTSSPQVTVTVTSAPKPKNVPVGAIVGGVVTGVVLLAIAGILLFFWLRKRRPGGKPYFYHPADPAEMLDDEHPGEYNPSIQDVHSP
ncbi:hypothetical protein BXZ70DRAFT_179352 [Cristinia sonorae]|uniref:Uncharacterized protein n=1 Tax=Cristinia sonorae TaxID=1940300 RepID=A0A8K0UNW7_9AGAR|nr:hypothetical protein BXZ70DRAFT_179352 [Cristinia sonorae]